MYVLSAFYGNLSALFFFQKKIQLLKWHLELFPLIYKLASTAKTVVLAQHKDFSHCTKKISETFFFFFFNQLLNDCKLPAKTILILAIFRML